MKIRKDYVTNSSSSSFVIAYKELPKIDESVIEQYPFLGAFEKMMESAIFGDTGNYETTAAEVFETLEEWDSHWVYENKYLTHHYCYEQTLDGIMKALDAKEKENGWSYQAERDSYEKPAKYLKDGYKVMEKSVAYRDEWLSDLLYNLEDEENFIILSSNER